MSLKLKQIVRLKKTAHSSSKPGVELRSLDIDKDLETANGVWSFKTPNTIPFFERMVRYNVSVGAYDENGKLLSWLLR